MQLPPIDNPFSRRYHEPLTPEDVEEIEETMNELVRELFANDPARLAEELDAPLIEKIDAYIGIAEYAAADPNLKDMPGVDQLAPALHDLLKAVNAYYNGLN